MVPIKYFMDTEFVERPCTIDIISIGIVAEDGREFYAESNEVDWSQAHPWVLRNVRPHLMYDFPDQRTCWFEDHGNISAFANRATIGRHLKSFLSYDTPELWAYYADYDWVAFCWLFGSMIDLPSGFPKYCRDVKQLCDDLGNPQLPTQTSTEHNALYDARWTREAHTFLKSYEKEAKA